MNSWWWTPWTWVCCDVDELKFGCDWEYCCDCSWVWAKERERDCKCGWELDNVFDREWEREWVRKWDCDWDREWGCEWGFSLILEEVVNYIVN